MDLMLLKPYFHGTASLSGAPFWLGNGLPYSPVTRMARGCKASSKRNPSTYGQGNTPERCPGICCTSYNVVNSTYRANDVGSAWFSRALSSNPFHGITMDQASTQRCRYTRSSAGNLARISSISQVLGRCTSPSTRTVQGRGFSVCAFRDGSSLPVPNS